MSNNYRYEIIMYWSEEDQAFIAEVPELPGCAADSGTSKRLLPTYKSLSKNGLKRQRSLGVLSLNPKAV